MRRWWNPALAAPALTVTVPLSGFALQNEERRALVRAGREFGSNPLAVAVATYDAIGLFLDVGNFRPVVRFLEKFEHAFAVETAEATGLGLHVVQGGVRLAMVAMLAMTAAQVVSAVIRSAGAEPLGFPVLTLYSLALGMTLVASHHSSPLTAFPVAFIGSAVLILLVVLSVARDRDMHVRRLSWLETVAMALLGAAAAMTYDLVYVAPPLAAGFILVRVVAAGHRPGFVLRTAALRRWLVLSVGFLAVFVPARLVIAGRCRNLECYSGSGVSFSPDVPGLTARRILTGAPPAGWSHTADRVRPYGFDVGVIDLASNWLLVVLLVAMTVVAGRAAVSTARSTAAVGSSQSGWLRLAASLGAFGAFTAVLPSLLVSLSAYIQWARPAVGEAWRDTLMVQVGWSFMITAVVVAGIAVAGSRRHKAVATALAATALCAGLAMTLFNNERMAHIGRGTPTSALVREISTAVIRIDLTDDGNTRRCNMIDAYTELYPGSQQWWWGPQLRQEIDHFMLDRYDRPFCDGPEAPKPGSTPPSVPEAIPAPRRSSRRRHQRRTARHPTPGTAYMLGDDSGGV